MNKRHTATQKIILLALLFCVCALSFPGAPMAAKPTPSEGTVTIRGELKVGLPVEILFDLKGYTIPQGAYASINVRLLHSPEGSEPTIKRGYPSTTIRFSTPGQYELNFILNQISKPSCGGVDATLLLETTRVLTIAQ